MATIRGFWQHANGKVYAVESTTFGEITAGAGPFNLDDLHDLNDYDYKPAIVDWLRTAMAERKLRRINPPKK
ncbi:MAG: hypothetical protein JSW47_04525 [Phycisphaerales bacterium]|nr:MAG: hypothetical protein JSW47_04525 [Phycisphaerales bacterium]